MNIEENPLLWQDLEFSKICHAEHFSNIDPEGLKDDVK
jgi:hypothetical protein